MSADRPEGIEERLRASLRAYADLVDAPEERADRAPAPRPVVARRRRRGAVLVAAVAAAAAAVVAGSVWLVGVDRSDPVAAVGTGSISTTTESPVEGAEGDTRAAAGAPTGPGQVLAVPASPEVGVPYAVDLLTHCGIVGTDIGGTWFAAEPPMVDGSGNPPPGWGNPYQRGTLTLLAADEAVFRDDSGHEVRFRAAGEATRPAPCD
jgi:hypothetical protein